MTGGYAMLNTINLVYDHVATLYTMGKPVIIYENGVGAPACISKNENVYTITAVSGETYTVEPA